MSERHKKAWVVTAVSLLAIGAVATFLLRGDGDDRDAARGSPAPTAVPADAGVASPAPLAPPERTAVAPAASSGPAGLVVQVVDASGAPRIGAPVECQLERDGKSLGEQFLGFTTAPRGELRIEDLEERGDEWLTRGLDVETLVVAVPCIGLPSPAQRILFDRAAGSTVVLVVPPSGSVTVHLRDPNGRAIDQTMDVVLQVLGADGIGVDDHGEFHVPHALRDVRFAPLALGRTLRIAGDSGGFFHLEEKTVAGPVRDGEDVLVEWQTPPECAFVTGRLVFPDGRAAPDTCVHWRLLGPAQEPERVNHSIRCRTDRDGGFRLALPRVAGKTLQYMWCDELDERGETPRRGIASTLPLHLSSGDTEAGSFVLVEVPLVLNYKVRAPDGSRVRSIAHAELVPRNWPADAEWRLDDAPEIKWCRNRSGGFDEFRARTLVEQFEVRASADDYAPGEWSTVRRGATGVELTLGERRQRRQK